MKNKKLMAADDFLDLFYVASAGQDNAFIKTVEMVVEDTPAVDAVPIEAAQPRWISVEERLPDENEYVLIFAGSVQVARIIKGITEEERAKMESGEIENPLVTCWESTNGYSLVPRSKLYRSADAFGNNRVSYCWKANGGPMSWFGQDVTHWMPLPEPPKEGD